MSDNNQNPSVYGGSIKFPNEQDYPLEVIVGAQAFREIERADLTNDTFSRRQKVYDWRNHVGELAERWAYLTFRERALIFVLAQQEADNEEWD